MKPLRLRAENFGPYADLDISFDDGCTVILGEHLNAPEGVDSNGAGKSHIILGIVTALYGPPPGTKLSELLTNTGEATELMLELTFSHGGETYRVRRSYSARGAGKSTLDLEQFTMAWEPLTAASIKETQAAIERLLGLNLATFLASSVRLQGYRSFADPSVSRVERCQLLADGLGLGEYDDYQTLARRDNRSLTARLSVLADRLAADVDDLSRIHDVRTDATRIATEQAEATAGLARAEMELERLTAEWQRLHDASQERRALEHAAAKAEIDRLQDREQAARTAAESIALNEEKLASLATADDVAAAEQTYSEARAAYDQAVSEAALLNAKRVEAEQRWRDLTAEQQQVAVKVGETYARARKLKAALANPSAETCALCQRPHTDESAHREIEACWADLSALDERTRDLFAAVGEAGARVAALQSEIAALVTPEAPSDFEVRRAREQHTERTRLEERIASWKAVAAEVEKPEHLDRKADALLKLEQARAVLARLPDHDQAQADRVKAAGVAARADVHEQRQRLQAATTEKARVETDLGRLTVLERKHAGEREEHDRLQADLDVVTLLDRAYGRDGIPALVIENAAIPYLETEATRILQRLGLSWQVELRTERALKSGDGTRAALDVVVVKEDGVEQPYHRFSGGEETRIGLALSLALAELLSSRVGAHSDLLAIDEPSFLDQAGMATLVDVLRELEATFATILLVSHIAELRDSFDSVIRVVKDGGRSRVVDSAAVGEKLLALARDASPSPAPVSAPEDSLFAGRVPADVREGQR